MSFLFFSLFAVSSAFGAQPVPGTDVECPAPAVPPEA